MVGDAPEHVGQPGLRIDVVQLGCLYQRRHDGGPLGASVRAGEQPRFTSECKAPERPLRRVVAETDPPVVEEAGEGRQALQHVVDRLGDR